MIYLTTEIVVDLHDRLVGERGGSFGGGHRGSAYEGVEAAVNAVKNSYYSDPYEIAAAYALYIAQGHVFLDGNKRTATGAMLVFLKVNRCPVRKLSNDQLARLTIQLQKRARQGEASSSIVMWLADAVRPRHR